MQYERQCGSDQSLGKRLDCMITIFSDGEVRSNEAVLQINPFLNPNITAYYTALHIAPGREVLF